MLEQYIDRLIVRATPLLGTPSKQHVFSFSDRQGPEADGGAHAGNAAALNTVKSVGGNIVGLRNNQRTKETGQ
jgi:hypothetical protein